MSDDRALATSLWVGVLAAPVAWAGQLLAGSEIEELACTPPPADGEVLGLSTDTAITAISAAAALIAFGGLLAAVGAIRRVRRAPEDDPNGRKRFMAQTGALSSALFVLLIVMGGALVLVLDRCRVS